MLTDGFNKDAQPNPKLYHAHIYYKVGAESEKAAKAFAQDLARRFPDHVEAVMEYDKPGGPHAVSNVAVHFKKQGFADIVSHLQFNSGELPVLVHPKSGDVIKDHIDYGLWLGKRQDGLLNDAYFVRKRSERKAQGPKP